MFAGKGRYGWTAPEPAYPDRSAPAFDHRIAITAGLGLKNLFDPDFPAFARDRQLGPCLGAIRQKHVRTLNLFACVALFEGEGTGREERRPEQCLSSIHPRSAPQRHLPRAGE